MDGSRAGVTIDKRLREATGAARRLIWLPPSTAKKIQIVRSNIIPAGLYKSEAAV